MKPFIKTGGRHRKLEGWPLVFTVLVTLSILVGGIVEFLPLVLIQQSVPQIETVKPWTPLELAGRDLYIREGCNNCHSQMVRPFRQEIERYGFTVSIGGSLYLVGVVLMVVNVWKTIQSAPKSLPDPAFALPQQTAATA